MTKRVLRDTLAYWVVLGAIAAVRFALLGTMVGGYGPTSLRTILASLRTFMDKPTLYKLAVPLSDELQFPSWLGSSLIDILIVVGILMVVRIIVRHCDWRVILFLAAWCVLGVLPTFQIWHIFPNLVGSRLFFLSSAPLCILIALAALPGIDQAGKDKLAWGAAAGSAALSCLYLGWALALQANLTPWVEAGKRMQNLQQQLQLISAQNQESRVALLDLPTDYRGAGMITRPMYLAIMLKPPFQERDDSKKFVACEFIGANGPTATEKVTAALSASGADFIWDDPSGRFVPWHESAGSGTFKYSFAKNAHAEYVTVPSHIPQKAVADWKPEAGKGCRIEQHPGFMRVFASQTDDTEILLPSVKVDPLRCRAINLQVRISTQSEPLNGPADAVKKDEPAQLQRNLAVFFVSGANHSNYPLAETVLLGQGSSPNTASAAPIANLLVRTDQNRDWALAEGISKLGLKLSKGDYFVDIYYVEGLNKQATGKQATGK